MREGVNMRCGDSGPQYQRILGVDTRSLVSCNHSVSLVDNLVSMSSNATSDLDFEKVC